MFRLADLGIVWWPVQLVQTGEDGSTEEATVHLAYRLFTEAELAEREQGLLRSVAAAAGEAGAEGEVDSRPFVRLLKAAGREHYATFRVDLRDRVTDWRGFADGDEEVPFSTERLDALLAYEPLFQVFHAGLYAASREAYRKNSRPGPAGMPARAQA